jgi:hypothetical protein
MIQCRQQQLEQIMFSNGTFLQLSPLASNSNVVTVFGDSHTFIEKTIRSVMLLSSEFYVSCLQLVSAPVVEMKATPSYDLTINKLGNITRDYHAEIVVQKHFVEIYGEEKQVKAAYKALTDMTSIRVFYHFIHS